MISFKEPFEEPHFLSESSHNKATLDVPHVQFLPKYPTLIHESFVIG